MIQLRRKRVGTDTFANFGINLWRGEGIDTQHVLSFATPDQVRHDVRQNVETLKPHGGYVFNSVHNIQAGVPPENIVAMFDAAYEAGVYD